MAGNNKKCGELPFIYLFLFALVFGLGFVSESQAVCPICGAEGDCDITITNYNSRLDKVTGIQKINIIRVVMPGRTTTSMSSLKSNVNNFSNFCDKASYGGLKLQLGVAVDFEVPVGGFSVTQSLAVAHEKTLPDSLICAIFWPTGLAGFSHAGSGNTYMKGNLFRDLIHEGGHVLGLAHSNKNINGVFDAYGDPSSYMGSLPSQNYAVNQQHWLDWPKEFEVVRINDCLSKKPYIDVPIRPVGSGGGGLTSTIPITYCYEVPGKTERIWIAIPKGMTNSVNKIEGGEIFIYSAENCKGKTGMVSGDTVFGRITNPVTAGPKEVKGVIVDPIDCQYTIGQFNGKNVNNYSQVTLRISLSAAPPDPNDPLIANWDFSEETGTTLTNTANSGRTSPATWNTNRTAITTTGDDTLLFSPTTNTLDGSCTYLDLVGAVSAITSGKVWSVVKITDFNFVGTAGERLRLGLTNALSNSPTAEFNLRRTASNSIHLMGYAGGTLPTTGVQIYNSNTFDGQLEVLTEYNFDTRTYQIFYRFGGSGAWISIGTVLTMQSGFAGNALRLAAGDTATAGTGSWADAGEYLHIDSIYLTRNDPRIENQPPSVSITYPEDGNIFDANTNITIQAQADDNDGDVTKVEFYNGTTLLGQVATTPVQSEIVNLASQAVIHGATAKYESAGGNIGYWTNVNDWVSWTATVIRPGTFEVWVNYAAANSSPDATYRVEVGNQHVNGTVVGTGTNWSTYNTVLLGTVNIAQAGQLAVNVIPETKPNGAVMNLRNVTLVPLNGDDILPYKYIWSNVPAGTHILTAVATDSNDANTVSAPVTIEVANIPGDIDGDGLINGIDLKIMSQNWLVNNGRFRQVGQTIGRWDFAEGTGGSAFDISDYNNTATLYDNASWIDGAINLDGAGDHLQTANSTTKLQLTDSYTISLRLNAASPQIDGTGIITKCGPETSMPANHWSLGFGGGATLGKIVVLNGATIWNSGITLAQIAGSWHHVAVVYSNGSISSYLDGSLVSNAPFAALPLNGDGNLKIGCDRQKLRYYKGLIDDISIFNYQLTAQEINALRSGTFQEPTSQIVCSQKPDGDLNDDCKVDFWDYAELAANWLK